MNQMNIKSRGLANKINHSISIIIISLFKTKVAFLEGRLLSSQSGQFKKYSKSSD